MIDLQREKYLILLLSPQALGKKQHHVWLKNAKKSTTSAPSVRRTTSTTKNTAFTKLLLPSCSYQAAFSKLLLPRRTTFAKKNYFCQEELLLPRRITFTKLLLPRRTTFTKLLLPRRTTFTSTTSSKKNAMSI